jgi:hypothetical protein
MLKNYLTKFISQSYAPKFVCISYDIPEIEIHGKKKLSRKGMLGRGRNRSLGRLPATSR